MLQATARAVVKAAVSNCHPLHREALSQPSAWAAQAPGEMLRLTAAFPTRLSALTKGRCQQISSQPQQARQPHAEGMRGLPGTADIRANPQRPVRKPEEVPARPVGSLVTPGFDREL